VANERFRKLHALTAIRDDRKYTKAGKLVAVMLTSHADRGGYCFPSLPLLAAETGLSRSVVAATLAELRSMLDGPLLVVSARRGRADGSGGRTSNMYQLKLNPNAGRKSPPVESADQTQAVGDLSPEIGGLSPETGGVESAGRTGSSTRSSTRSRTKRSASTSDASSFALSVVTSKPKTRKAKASEETTPGHQEITAHYFAEFRAKHGRDPIFGPAEGKAVKDLATKLNGDIAEAKRRISIAFASWRGATITIRAITANPDQFATAEAPRKANGRHAPQQTDADSVQAVIAAHQGNFQ
jgi:hypothetical protein